MDRLPTNLTDIVNPYSAFAIRREPGQPAHLHILNLIFPKLIMVSYKNGHSAGQGLKYVYVQRLSILFKYIKSKREEILPSVKLSVHETCHAFFSGSSFGFL